MQYTKVFNDLDKFRDYCRFEGKVFNEADLYKKEAPVWEAYQKYQGWLRAKNVMQDVSLTIGETNDYSYCRY